MTANPATSDPPARMTVEQAVAAAPDDGRWELIDGELRTMNLPGYRHGIVAMNIALKVGSFVGEHDLGRLLAAETGFLLKRNPDTLRGPDVAFVRKERHDPERAGFFEGAPDLAVEVVSPSDRTGDVWDKARAWLDAGCREVWVVWPATRSMTVHRPGDDEPLLFHDGDRYADGPVVPGLDLELADLFV